MEKRTKFKKFSALMLVFAIIVCFTGCMRYSMTAKISSDGTADITFVYAIMEDYATGMDDSQVYQLPIQHERLSDKCRLLHLF